MNNLLTLCGPIGCGKTTLIERFLRQNKNFTFVDVFDYIKKYTDKTGHIEQEKTLLAYGQMYGDLSNLKGNIILELGTSNAQLNIKNLADLSDKFNVKIVFCLLDSKSCFKRTIERQKKDKERLINKQDLEKRLKRPFPDKHLKLAGDSNLIYATVDMGLLPEKILEEINNFILK